MSVVVKNPDLEVTVRAECGGRIDHITDLARRTVAGTCMLKLHPALAIDFSRLIGREGKTRWPDGRAQMGAQGVGGPIVNIASTAAQPAGPPRVEVGPRRDVAGCDPRASR